MATTESATPDHNSLGKASFVIGLIALVLSIIPFIGFISWILAPLALLCGAIAMRRAPRSLAIAGLITGGLALLVCFMWVNATKSVGEAMSADTFNTTGEAQDTSTAPILDASIKGLWNDMEANKVAAGRKYGGHRLRFTNEPINDFAGDADNPALSFEGKNERYLTMLVSASFSKEDGEAIANLGKGDRVTFVCSQVQETFGDGYSLAGCRLSD